MKPGTMRRFVNQILQAFKPEQYETFDARHYELRMTSTGSEEVCGWWDEVFGCWCQEITKNDGTVLRYQSQGFTTPRIRVDKFEPWRVVYERATRGRGPDAAA